MSNYHSVAARVPAAHQHNLEQVLSLVANDEVRLGVELSAVPHETEEGMAAPPATHYAMNNEATPVDFLVKVDAIRSGGIDDVLPGVQWGTGDLPSKEQAVAAIAAAGFFQRLDDETTPSDHFEQTCGTGSALGLMRVWPY